MLVLADQLRGGMLGFAHLEQRVVRVDSSLLTVLAEIKVSALSALISNTRDGRHGAAIADDVFKDCVALILLLLNQVFLEHGLELRGAVLTNFLTDHLDDRADLLGADDARAVALAAGQTLLVCCRSHTLEARDRLLLDGFLFFWNDDFAADLAILYVSFVLRTGIKSSHLDAVRTDILGLRDVLAPDAAHHNWIRTYG